MLVCPVAPHSIANQVAASLSPDHPMTEVRFTAFRDQLRSLFDAQSSLADRTGHRLVTRARSLGFTDDSVAIDEFMIASASAGFRPDAEIAAFLQWLHDGVERQMLEP
ncbi:MAG: hypothetical protein F2534_21170 [Actinobacteria bacterium]|uniref:Unannotated protein n=1 Tax=freshwater metagenome TaxID=449393 RepID=A0A6J6G8W2_9ZZZZ|nr:hypothetical protein [Actinomycetota bacterium]